MLAAATSPAGTASCAWPCAISGDRWTTEDSRLGQDPDVLIVGGGLAGLACAVGLAASGLRVLVIEGEAAWGGRAGSRLDPRTGDRLDVGPHVVLTEYPNFLQLLAATGARDPVAWQDDTLITLVNGRGTTDIRPWRLPAPLHLLPGMMKVRDVSPRDQLSNRRALALGLRFREEDVPALDPIPASALLRALGVSRRFTDWFWRSATLALLNTPLEKCSSAALMRVFSQLLGRADARFGLPARPLEDLFVPGAMRVIRSAGGELRQATRAAALVHDGSTCTGAILAGGERIRARWCVCAVPPTDLARILPAPWRRERPFDALDRFTPSPYISVYLWFDRRLTRARSWARTWSPTGLNTDFYDLSNIRTGWAGRESVIASNIIYSWRAAHLDDDAIVRGTLRELADFVPGVALRRVVHRRIHRIPMAIPCPLPGTETARPATTTDFGGLLLAGDWTRTSLPCSMESAVRSGFLAAEVILRDVGRPRELARLPRPPSGIAGLVHAWQRKSRTGDTTRFRKRSAPPTHDRSQGEAPRTGTRQASVEEEP